MRRPPLLLLLIALFLPVLASAHPIVWPGAAGGGGTATVSGIVDDAGCLANQVITRNALDTAFECSGAAAGGDSVRVESGDDTGVFSSAVDADFEDSGDINFVLDATPTPDQITGHIRAGRVGTAEAAALDASDITTGNFVDGLVLGAQEENEIDLLDLQDTAADNCAAGEEVQRNGTDTGFECVPQNELGTSLTSATNNITSTGGTVVLSGSGGVNNEDLSFNFETTADQILLASTTGATFIGIGGFGLTSGADPADLGDVRFSNGEQLCWETDPASANDFCIQGSQFEQFLIGGTQGVNFGGPIGVAGIINSTTGIPRIEFDDTTDAGTFPEGNIIIDCPTTDDCDFDLQISAAGTVSTWLRVDTDDSGGKNVEVVGAAAGIEMVTNFATECQMLEAADGDCSTTGGCTPEAIAGTNFDYDTLNFGTGADAAGTWAFQLPSNLVGTTASVSFVWTSNHADCDNNAADTVCWVVDGDSYANDAVWHTGAFGGTAVGSIDTCILNGDLLESPAVTFTHSMVAGERAVVQVTRDVDAGIGGNCTTDTYTQDAKLLAVKFCYEVDNVFSGE